MQSLKVTSLSIACAALLALGGCATNPMLEGSASKEAGLLVTVRLDGGQVLAITQAADVRLAVGERVQVLAGRDGKARVLPL